ncbi:MAG: PQQ-dependent dehydrogenase, methanol/ethanol family [Pseudomonadota bacterium]
MKSAALAALSLLLIGCGQSEGPETAPLEEPQPTAWVDADRLAEAAAEPQNWFTSGRDSGGTYYSPLDEINVETVARLGVAWDYNLGTARGMEATPIVVDGVMVFSGLWGRAYALDASTGEELWTFDPRVTEFDPQAARKACCDVVNRGLSVWEGLVYVAALDGRLFALDIETGDEVWSTQTIPDAPEMAYTVSGGPQIAGDVIVVGSSGADFAARGYVAAFDLKTGALRWRSYLAPRDPALGPQESADLEAALASWSDETDWSFGAGGTVWDGMAYDPDLNLLYVGTGNAAPYNLDARSPGGGDNLYLASILALNPATGDIAWAYQTVPGDNWDYTATAKFILADLPINGQTRSVIMQAPKNGFFYVLDRATGELISADPYVFVNWADGVDSETGRPIPNTEVAGYTDEPRLVFPGMQGAHNWHPMAFNPKTGLVYIPAIEAGMVFINTRDRPAGLIEGMFYAAGLFAEDYDPEGLAPLFGDLPEMSELMKIAGVETPPTSYNVLRAWDPVARRIVWDQVYPDTFWDGGVMTTGGGLVFRGDAIGKFSAFNAETGDLLKELNVGASIMAAPMTYAVDGRQYVAVLTGYGGGGGVAFTPQTAAYKYGNANRLLVFALDSDAPVLPPRWEHLAPPEPPDRFGTQDQIADGGLLFTRHCMRCHVGGPGLAPDLPSSATLAFAEAFDAVVLEGSLSLNGMSSFDDILSAEDTDAIRAYLVDAAHAAYGE